MGHACLGRGYFGANFAVCALWCGHCHSPRAYVKSNHQPPDSCVCHSSANSICTVYFHMYCKLSQRKHAKARGICGAMQFSCCGPGLFSGCGFCNLSSIYIDSLNVMREIILKIIFVKTFCIF